MAEAFAALGIAANIFQFLELGLKTTRSIIATYRSVDIDGLAQHTADLSLTSSDFREQCSQLKTDIEIAKDSSLVSLLTRCVATAEDINKEIGSLKIPKSKRFKKWSRIWFGLKASRKSSKIEGLQADLVEMRDQICIRLQGLVYEHQRTLSRSMGTLGEVSKAWNTATTQRLDEMGRQIGDLLAAHMTSATDSDRSDSEFVKLAATLKRFASEAKNHGLVRAILESLHFAEIKERQNEIPEAHQNTFQWIFREDSTTTFPAWLRESGGLFWVTGKPGSGKSTLMKFILSHQRMTELSEAWAGDKRLLLVSHFFWYGGNKIQRSQEGLLRTLLFQILVNYPELIQVLFPERCGDSFRYLESWSLEELVTAFEVIKVQPDLPCRILMFVDGLDEYIGDMTDLTKFLHAVAGSPNIKICCASRPWQEFQRAFGGTSAQIEMHNLTVQDMSLYVQDTLEKSKPFEKIQSSQPSKAEALVKSISLRAEGVFFWVFLVVRSILRGLGNNDKIEVLQRRVLELPQDLDQFFRRMLDSIEHIYKPEVYGAFAALLMAKSRLPASILLVHENLRGLNKQDKVAWRRVEIGMSSPRKLPVTELYRGEVSFHDSGVMSEFYRTEFAGHELDRYYRRLISQCRDLVQAWGSMNSGYGMEIGFLHRTVIEFLQRSNPDLTNPMVYPRYIFARSYFEHFCLSLRGPFEITWQYALRFIHVLLETETRPGGIDDDGYQILDRCEQMWERLRDPKVLPLLTSHQTNTAFRLLSRARAEILVKKYEWESKQAEQGFIHLYEKNRSRQILEHILEGSVFIEVGDIATPRVTDVVDLDLLDKLLYLNEFKRHIANTTTAKVWRRFIKELQSPVVRRNTFETCQVLIRHGAPRIIPDYPGEGDAIGLMRQREAFPEEQLAELEKLFPARNLTSMMMASRTKRKNKRKGKKRA
ncbi:hypothetical protein CPLU01_15829 [Colletotrichum plurivorum]|uniref:Nephrocystin 3-like N-terminal domain-containing protein n=1 Tax=Colletotrichum plurivorum TaxID=2175906 RepID=A0A8H6MT30_9PEZI|nr:hypothetical protein CPLU01_15829 [Colletotrichum plurivorum]